MNNSYDLLLWDFDGTIADTLPGMATIYNRLADRMGLCPVADWEAARRLPTRQFLRQHKIYFWRLPRLSRAFRSEIGAMIHEVRLVDGISDVLRQLRPHYELAILSSNSEANIRLCLENNDVSDCFSFVVGDPRLFGKAKLMKRIVRRRRLDPARVLYLGDETRDVEAAHKAGLSVGAVTWGAHDEPLLTSYRPDFVFRQPAELAAALVGCQPA